MPNTACERWKSELDKFIETGEASEEFLTHLDNCEYCQATVEIAFDRQAKAFERLGAYIRNNLRNKKK